jgi:plasmid maintenance system antidote protein VapI
MDQGNIFQFKRSPVAESVFVNLSLFDLSVEFWLELDQSVAQLLNSKKENNKQMICSYHLLTSWLGFVRP